MHTHQEHSEQRSDVSVNKISNEHGINTATRTGGISTFSVLVLLVLLAVFMACAFILDLGKGPLVQMNQMYFGGSTISEVGRVDEPRRLPVENLKPAENKSYAKDCPSEQLKLITDATTLNGASVSCWPNTVTESGSRVNTIPAVSSVVCPPGKGKVQSGDSNIPQIRVSCS